MKFTLSWLENYIDSGLSSAEIADRLTMAGLEVDSVEELGADLDERVKTARVEEVRPHPDADRLTLCTVSTGEASHQVVCGAPNVRPGLITALATLGAVLPGGFTIKKAKLRGQVSEGMLCSGKELGIGDDEAGIMELPPETPVGLPLVEALGLRDTLIEVDLTPNRPDCASVLGIAREVAGFAGKRMTPPIGGEPAPLTGGDLPFAVEVHADDCPRYCARLVRDVAIGPSPWWLQRLLRAVGLRPINNVVDITNFVMLEYGQPLHAFDFARLAGGRIVVRKAEEGETITTLDGVERTLDKEMLLICDAERPVAVAGVMGGEESEVRETTTDILLESAYFDPISIRRTRSRLNMNTDSSYRFERGVDPQGVPRALARAVQLIAELAGGTVVEGGIDHCSNLPTPPELTLRVGRTVDLLGIAMDADEIAGLLNGIEIDTQKRDDQSLAVQVPSFRVDIEREIDLVEEVARLKGYNDIPTTLPQVPMRFPESDPERGLRRQAAGVMTALGFCEAINYSFVDERHFDLLGLADDHPARTTVRLMNPLAEDQAVMRTMLLPGLLENLRHNLSHQLDAVRLFETGKVFQPTAGEELPAEELCLAAVLSGRRQPGAALLHEGEALVDIYDAKGAVEQLLAELRLPQLQLVAGEGSPVYADPEAYLALRTADGAAIGGCGRLAPKVAKAFGIKQEVFFIDLSLDRLGRQDASPKAFVALPKYPAVRWDVAFVVAEEVGAGDLAAAIEASNEPLIEKVEIFDVYRGKPIEAGLKSVAITITYRSEEKTLDDATVGRVHERIIAMIQSGFKARLREA